jgi:hypothetical protein
MAIAAMTEDSVIAAIAIEDVETARRVLENHVVEYSYN